jgi:hypothetical protein
LMALRQIASIRDFASPRHIKSARQR